MSLEIQKTELLPPFISSTLILNHYIFGNQRWLLQQNEGERQNGLAVAYRDSGGGLNIQIGSKKIKTGFSGSHDPKDAQTMYDLLKTNGFTEEDCRRIQICYNQDKRTLFSTDIPRRLLNTLGNTPFFNHPLDGDYSTAILNLDDFLKAKFDILEGTLIKNVVDGTLTQTSKIAVDFILSGRRYQGIIEEKMLYTENGLEVSSVSSTNKELLELILSVPFRNLEVTGCDKKQYPEPGRYPDPDQVRFNFFLGDVQEHPETLEHKIILFNSQNARNGHKQLLFHMQDAYLGFSAAEHLANDYKELHAQITTLRQRLQTIFHNEESTLKQKTAALDSLYYLNAQLYNFQDKVQQDASFPHKLTNNIVLIEMNLQKSVDISVLMYIDELQNQKAKIQDKIYLQILKGLTEKISNFYISDSKISPNYHVQHLSIFKNMCALTTALANFTVTKNEEEAEKIQIAQAGLYKDSCILQSRGNKLQRFVFGYAYEDSKELVRYCGDLSYRASLIRFGKEHLDIDTAETKVIEGAEDTGRNSPPQSL